MDKIKNPELPVDPRQFVDGDESTPATPISTEWLNALQSELIALITASGQVPSAADLQQVLKAVQALGSSPPKVDIFTVSGTWTKPAGASVISVLLIAGGGGGKYGASGASGAVYGGWSGAGGSVFMGTFPAGIFSASHAVVVGKGGTGLPPNFTDINGIADGHASEIVGLFVAPTGGPSASTSNTLAATSPAMFPGQQPLTSSTSTTASTLQNPYNGDSLKRMILTGMPAGSPGGSIDTAGAAQPGSVFIGNLPAGATGNYVHGLSGLVRYDSGIPSKVMTTILDGDNASNYLNGTSGAGGAASLTGNGQDGGHGGKYGCGGGGGGAARPPYLGGHGGNGADGIVVIITHH